MTVNDVNDIDKNKQKQSKLKIKFIQNLTDIIACGICGVRSGTGTGFLQVLQFPLPILIPTAPHPLIILSVMLYSLNPDSVIK
jgi:hypothetical protein